MGQFSPSVLLDQHSCVISMPLGGSISYHKSTLRFSNTAENIKNKYETANEMYFQSKSTNIWGLSLPIVSQRVLTIFTASSSIGVNLFYCMQTGDGN